jgi:hypothetical protein
LISDSLSAAPTEDRKMVAKMSAPHAPSQNHLLATIPEEVFDRLSHHLELVSMPLGEVLYESGGKLHHVYFPTTSIVSLHYVMENGASAEIAGVGNEGVVGISLFMGGDTTPSRATVQTAGHGYRLKERLMMEEFNRAGDALDVALYPGPDHPDVPDCGLQPASFDGTANVPLAVVHAGPAAVK